MWESEKKLNILYRGNYPQNKLYDLKFRHINLHRAYRSANRQMIEKIINNIKVREAGCQYFPVSWQDMSRNQGSSFGTNIVDATITETNDSKIVYMLRKPNFNDQSHLLLSSELKLPLPSGNIVTLDDLLANFGKYMKEENLWTKLPENHSLSQQMHLSKAIKPFGIMNRFDGTAYYKTRFNNDNGKTEVVVWPFSKSPEEIFTDDRLLPELMQAMYAIGREPPSLFQLSTLALARDVFPKLNELKARLSSTETDVTDEQLITYYAKSFPDLSSEKVADGLGILFDICNKFNDSLEEGGYHIPMEHLSKGVIEETKTYKSFQTDQGREEVEIGGERFSQNIAVTEQVTRRIMCAFLSLQGRDYVEFTCALYTFSAPVLAILVYTNENGDERSSFRYLPPNEKTRVSIVESTRMDGGRPTSWELKAMKATPNLSASHVNMDEQTVEEKAATAKGDNLSRVTIYQIPLQSTGDLHLGGLPGMGGGLGGMDLGDMDLGGIGLGGPAWWAGGMDYDDERPAVVYRSLGGIDDNLSYAANINAGELMGEPISYNHTATDIKREHGAHITVTEIYYAVTENIPDETSVSNRAQFMKQQYETHQTESIFNIQTIIRNMWTNSLVRKPNNENETVPMDF